MISSKNWNDLNTFVIRRLKKVKVLLIGDECQLPPVNEKTSIVFKHKYKKFELTEIIRSKSNQLTQIYNLYRNAVNTNKIAEVKLIDSKLSNHFKKNDFKYIHSFNIKKSFNIDKDKIISYSNVSVDNYNKLVRNIFFNNPKEKFVKGENLIFGSSIKITSLNHNFMEDKIYYYSNDEVKVISVTKEYINMNFVSNYTDMNIQPFFPEKKFEVYKLLISNDELYTIYVITNQDYLKFKKYFENSFDLITEYITENKIRKRKISELWDIYYTIKNTINTPVKYSYALTVYKSQGSTFRKVYIDQENIENCIKDITILNKSLYTAITRASHKIRCYKKEKNDYYIIDIHQFPILKQKIKIDNNRVKKALIQGFNILYTRNNFNSNTRKLVSAKVISNSDKIIIGNNNFEWELKISNDMNFYL